MSNKPRICALMLAYFKSGMTKRCLETLMNQGIDKLILVDNSADIEENQRTTSLMDSFSKDWLTVIIAPENLGFARGMNLALEYACQLGKWDYILILNNDIEAEPNLIESLSNHISQHPETAMVTATTKTLHELQGENYYHRWTGLLFKRPIVGSFLFLGGHCLLIRATAISDKLFNTRYFMYGEDIELNWRLIKQGWKLDILPDILLTHQCSGSSSNGSFFYEYHINRWHLLIVQALANNFLELVTMYALRLPILVLRALFRSWRFRCITPLKALGLASISLPIRPSINN